jgi:Protein of unknown function (DUF2851)
VFSPGKNFYATWRARTCAVNFLRDENFPTERLLQAIWQHQRLRRDGLKMADGRRVRVFHPGFASLEGGPDFRDAVVQIGDAAPQSGDVEIDLQAGGWRAHGHDRNANFRNVMLHVVWDQVGVPASAGPPGSKPDRRKLEPQPPVLSLKNVLDAPLADLSLALDRESLRTLPEGLRGKCSAPLREMDGAKVDELLAAAARVRFENKASMIRFRAKNVGWDQALWENLFRALGYKHNAWPMQHLAEMRPAWTQNGATAFEIQARLLGLSGLLPDQLTRSQKNTDDYLRRLWDLWWREREAFADDILPRVAWRFHGVRPANHPQRRLALASHWLADDGFVARIESWSIADVPDQKLLKSLTGLLQVKRDDFWSWHWAFRSPRLKKPQPLLGEARITDLALNVILPWLWIRSVTGKNEKVRREVERRYSAWPAAEDNSVLKLGRQRLLGTGNARALRTAGAQQGLMQIIRDFCEHSNAVCDQCPFPDFLRGQE